MLENLTGKELGREHKVRRYRRLLVGLRAAVRTLDNLTLEEAGDENIAADLIERKDRFEQAVATIRRDLKLKTPERLKI